MNATSKSIESRVSVSICIATYKRPQQLRELLAGIAALVFRRVAEPDITVVVVDNDPSASAEKTCNSSPLPWTLKYAVETRRGIAQARNRAVRESVGANFIAFIDDDEFPEPLWLDELLAAQECFGSDVVCGSVIPNFAEDVPNWVKAGRFFERRLYASGYSLDKCSTNNVLIRRSLFTHVHSFDERFALTGGEDTQFFLRVHKAGYTIISSAEARVYEPISKARGNLPWILRRAYQSGNSWVLCECSLDRRTSTGIVRMTKACGWIVVGVVSACFSPLFGMAAVARSLRNVVLGMGMLTALVGQSYQPYQTAGADTAN
jgi:succinoglycan biosynthesis protein ExoM